MLTSISDAAKGMYYFVQETKNIHIMFAECLGGLLSTIAKDVKLSFTTAKGVVVEQVMTKYKSEKGKDEKWTIDLGDIYAEEQRNIPIRIKLLALSQPQTNVDDCTVVTFDISYFHIFKKTNETATSSVVVLRPGDEKEVKEDPQELAKRMGLDEQRNRIAAAEALESATNFGLQGRMEQAKEVLMVSFLL
jgi:hypothetical protein